MGSSKARVDGEALRLGIRSESTLNQLFMKFAPQNQILHAKNLRKRVFSINL